jgi:hypothetical protein
MGKTRIYETTDYNRFELLSFNRNVRNTKALAESMRKYGWINSRPMDVFSSGNGKLIIRDGHHRFEVAQTLGIPVKYVICDDSASIYDLDISTNKWSLKDFLVSYCREGNHPEYQAIQDYCEETGVAIQIAISLLAGQLAMSNNFGSKFKNGTFQINRRSTLASDVKQLVLLCKSVEIPFYNTNYLVQAFSKIVQVEHFNMKQMKSKIKQFKSLFEKKALVDQYLEMLEDIYNRKSRVKVPLKFLANEASKKRQQIWENKNKGC